MYFKFVKIKGRSYPIENRAAQTVGYFCARFPCGRFHLSVGVRGILIVMACGNVPAQILPH
jgi:hypothetical protein